MLASRLHQLVIPANFIKIECPCMDTARLGWNGYETSSPGWVSGIKKKFKYGSSRVPIHVKIYQKTLASLQKWSIDTKVWNMCLRQRQIFHGHIIFQHFHHVASFKSINNVFETGKYHSWPNTLPFQNGYRGANTRTPGPGPSTHCSTTACDTPPVS